MLYYALNLTLPLEDPILKFLIILLIILGAPLLLNKLKIPHLLGLIIAGAIIGPHGFNLVLRDSSIIMSGTAGLLYIMFLAGMEIDMNDFKRNSLKSMTFGMYTFLIPMLVGTVVGRWVLGFSWLTSVLLASMFASHTLIAYPIISKYGIVKNPAVGITVGGTMVTDMLALLVLTIVVGMTTGEVNSAFWVRLGISIVLFTAIILFLFPLLTRHFFKHVSDSISQYIYVLSLLFLGAFLAQLAGIEGIIGAFLVGLSLNRLIPRSSPLMNRVEFVGNALFIPFFLLSVGMLIDYRAFFESWDTLMVGVVMILVATGTKLAAAWLTQRTFHFTADQRRVIFGLSNAQAAATLAAVLVGYNIILGEDAQGNPIRLLNDSVLNGTILMILVTCIIATVIAQKGARNIALEEMKHLSTKDKKEVYREHILIPVSNRHTVEELINLSLAVKNPQNRDGIYALRVINTNESDERELKASKALLDQAVHTAAAADVHVHDLIRYDLSVSNAITSVVRENDITDIVLGLHQKHSVPADFLGKINDGVIGRSGVNAFIYKAIQPLATVKRNIFLVPTNAEKETGFSHVLQKIKTITANTGAAVVIYAAEETLAVIRKFFGEDASKMDFRDFDDWNDFLIAFREVKANDCLWILLSRRDGLSYHPIMPKIPGYLNRYLQNNNFILIYPQQDEETEKRPFLI